MYKSDPNTLTPFQEPVEDKYQNLIEHLNDGFVLVDTKLQLMQFNPAFARIMEYEPGELKGMNALQVARSDNDRQALLDGIRRRIEHKLDSYEVTFVAKSGKYVPAYVTPTPYVNANNEVIGSFAIIQDLTQIKEAQSTIKYQSDILDNVSEGIIVTDLEGNIRYFNSSVEEILGIELNEITGHKVYELNVNEFADDIAAKFAWLVKQKASQWELEIKTNIDADRFIRISTAQLKSFSNDIDGLIMIISDFTELHISKKEAQSANLAKSRFLATVSHDLRTPMIGIIGASDLLSLEELTAYQQELIFTIKQCGQQLLELIDDVMDISRIEAGVVLIDKKAFNLHQLLDECTNTIDAGIKKQGIILIIDTAPDVPSWLVGDPVQIRRVIVNLLHNAAKFTSSGYIILKVVCADTKESETTVQFSVKDTGKGIPEEELHRVFEAFHQVGEPSAEGIGMGLAICKQLVELMGGHIWVESEINKGTTFSFTLTMETTEKNQKATGDNLIPHSLANLDKSKKLIMIVDDNQMNRKILAYMLHKAGYNIAVAESGSKCLELLKLQRYDLILMDMQMPEMSGYQATKIIKADPFYQDIPVIALTANALVGDAEICRRAGCDGYLPKPVTSTNLYSTLDKIWAAEMIPANSDKVMLEQLIPECKAHLQEYGQNLQSAMENQDYAEIMAISHDIKGMAGMYGYLKLSQLAGDINIWARRQDFQKCTSVDIALQEELNRLLRN